MENGRTGPNAAVDIKVASSKKADSGSEKADSGSKKASSGKAFAKALGLLLSIALLLSLAACVGTEGGQSGSGDDAEQPIDGDTPPEGDADPIEDGTAPTGDGDTSTDDTTEDGSTEDEDVANNENGNSESENPDDATEPDKPTAGDTEPNGEKPENTQNAESVYPDGTFRIDKDGNRVFRFNGKDVDEDTYLAQKVNALEYYRREFSYTDESREKSIEEIAEILYTMLYDSAREYNDDLGFIIVEGNIAEIIIIDEEVIALETEQGTDKEINSWSNVFPEISENCWGSVSWIGVHAFAGYIWPLSTESLDIVKTAEDYEEGMFAFEGTGSGYRYIVKDPLTNTYTLSKPLPIPW